MKRYAYGWITALFFLVSIALHWLFGWWAYVDEAQSHHQAPELAAYAIEMGRDTFENWQSEFLQLIWQVAGLAMLLHVGSPQSKEGDDRMEAKLDLIYLHLDPKNGQRTLDEIDDHYLGRHTDSRLVNR